MKNMLKSITMSLVVVKFLKNICATSLLIVAVGGITCAQEIELYGGINRFKMLDGNDRESHSTSVQPFIGIAVGEIFRYEIFSLRLEAEYYKISRTYNINSGGNGAGATSYGSVRNSNLSIRAYPFNIRVMKELELNFGLAWTPALSYTDTGSIDSWNLMTGGNTRNYNVNKGPFEQISGGIAARIAYRAQLGKRWLLTPQYRFIIDRPGIMHTFGFGLTYLKIKDENND